MHIVLELLYSIYTTTWHEDGQKAIIEGFNKDLDGIIDDIKYTKTPLPLIKVYHQLKTYDHFVDIEIIDDIFNETMNNKENSEIICNLLAIYCDKIFSKYSVNNELFETCNELGIESTGISYTMDLIIDLLYDRIQQNHDIFENKYYECLAIRLLSNLHEHIELEIKFLDKVKRYSDDKEWIEKIETMIIDVQISERFMLKYLSAHRVYPYYNKSDNKCKLNAIVCSSNAWPTKLFSMQNRLNELNNNNDMISKGNNNGLWIIPNDVRKTCEKFSKFYCEKYKSKRNLTFLMNYGTGHLLLKNINNIYCKNIICTTKQMLILLLFDAKSDYLTFDQIYNTLNKINGITRKEVIIYV